MANQVVLMESRIRVTRFFPKTRRKTMAARERRDGRGYPGIGAKIVENGNRQHGEVYRGASWIGSRYRRIWRGRQPGRGMSTPAQVNGGSVRDNVWKGATMDIRDQVRSPSTSSMSSESTCGCGLRDPAAIWASARFTTRRSPPSPCTWCISSTSAFRAARAGTSSNLSRRRRASAFTKR